MSFTKEELVLLQEEFEDAFLSMLGFAITSMGQRNRLHEEHLKTYKTIVNTVRYKSSKVQKNWEMFLFAKSKPHIKFNHEGVQAVEALRTDINLIYVAKTDIKGQDYTRMLSYVKTVSKALGVKR